MRFYPNLQHNNTNMYDTIKYIIEHLDKMVT